MALIISVISVYISVISVYMKPQIFGIHILILCFVLWAEGISFGQEEGAIGAALKEQPSNAQKQAEARVTALKKELETEKEHFRKFLKKLSAEQKQAEAQIEILKKDLLQSQNSLNKKESKIIALTASIDNLKAKNKNLQKTIALKKRFSDVPKRVEVRVAALKKQLEIQKKAFKRELEDVREQAEIQLETLKKNLQQSPDSVGATISINNLKAENKSLKKQLFDAQDELNNVQAGHKKVLSAKEKEVSVLNDTNLEKKISELSAALEEMQSKKLSLQIALDNSQQSLKEKEKKLLGMRDALGSSPKNKERKARVLKTGSREPLSKHVFSLREKQKEINRLNKFAKKREVEARLAEKKLADFQQKVQKERLSLHYNLAVVYDKNGMYLDALKEYEKALAVDSNDPDTYYNLAILYDDHLNDNRAAIGYYQKYLDLRPDADDVSQVREWVIRAERDLGITKPCKAEKKVKGERK